jgi:hypothetical protein
MTKLKTGEYTSRIYKHRGIRVEQVGCIFHVWLDFVNQSWNQPWCNSLAKCADLINAMVAT